MTLTEKVAYLKGLMEGLNTDDKVIGLIADILSDMAGEIQGMQDDMEEISEVVDTIDEDLGELEKDFYDIDEDECGCGHTIMTIAAMMTTMRTMTKSFSMMTMSFMKLPAPPAMILSA